jgi:hypothetical protein
MGARTTPLEQRTSVQITVRGVEIPLYKKIVNSATERGVSQNDILLGVLRREFFEERSEDVLSLLPDHLKTAIEAYAQVVGKSILAQIIEDLSDMYL